MFTQLALGWNLTIFVAAAAVVWYAGTQLAHAADAIAEQTGLGREMLGILLLGGVTSMPELAVAVTATVQGTPALTINDVLGSAAINVVILAVADAFIGRGALTSVQGSPGVMLQGLIGIVLMMLVAASYVTGDRPILGIGVWPWLMLLVYLSSIRLLARSNVSRAWTAADREAHEGSAAADKPENESGPSLRRLILRTIAAGVAILGAGFLLAQTGEALAEQTGLGTSFFGAVFLGFSTSLPEWSTVIAAVRLRRYAMAIADIFGTNLFNVTIIALVDALHGGGPVLVEAGPFAAFAAILAAFLTAIFIAGLLERRNRTVLRMGFDSVAVIICYIAGVVVLHGLR